PCPALGPPEPNAGVARRAPAAGAAGWTRLLWAGRARQAGRDVVNPPPQEPRYFRLTKAHVPGCQNLWSVHARDARRRAGCWRRYGRLRVFSAFAPAHRAGDGARAGPAGPWARAKGRTDRRCRRCGAGRDRRGAAAGYFAVARP